MMAQQQELLQRLVQNQTQPQPNAAATRKRKAKGQGKKSKPAMPPPAAPPPPLGSATPASTSTGIFHSLRSAFGGSQPQLQQEEIPPSSNNTQNTEDAHSDFQILRSPSSPTDDDQRSLSSASQHRHQLGPVNPNPGSIQLGPVAPAPGSVHSLHHSIHSSNPPFTRDQTPFPDFHLGGTTKDIWITKCELQLNGQAVDQLESKQTKDQCINDYNRLFMTNSLGNSMQSNYISYALFRGGAFVSAWDLSTSGFVGNSFVLPNIKTGEKRY